MRSNPIACIAAAVAAIAALAQEATAREEIRRERIKFAAGQSSARVVGAIRGYGGVDYLIRTTAGQVLSVRLRWAGHPAYFNLLPPRSRAEAIFIGSTQGNRFVGRLSQSGIYTIRVYQMRSAARRGTVARYILDVTIAARRAQVVDAKGTMPCSMGRPAYNRQCPWTVRRLSQSQATIRITRPGGRVRILQFSRGEFSSAGARLKYRRAGDFWLLSVNDREFYRFASVVITGD